jgi:hypothetical protein
VPAPQASEALYTTLQRYQLALLVIGRRLWRRILPDNLDGSWQRVMPQLVAFTAGAQLAAAQSAVAYVPAVLDETGQLNRPLAVVRPAAFSGVAYDGRPLDTMLEGSVRTAKARIGAGATSREALVGGREWLEQALQTAVADAARDATAAAMVVRQTTGWVRMVNPPCCSRCAVLAGVWYRWNKPLLRHPGCDCLFIPAAENVAGDFLTDPGELVRRGLVNDITPDQQRRLDGGDNLTKVLNETRDAWRVRMALERKREKAQRLAAPQGWGAAEPLPAGGIQDFMSHLTSRVQALEELRRHGIAE